MALMLMLMLMLISSMFYASFTGVMSGQMRRIPGVPPTAIYTQLASGAFACCTLLLPTIFFIVASFRPERDPQLTQLLNDLSGIILVIPWPPFMMQNFTFAWSGLLVIWIPAFIFIVWFVIVTLQLLKAIDRAARETGLR